MMIGLAGYALRPQRSCLRRGKVVEGGSVVDVVLVSAFGQGEGAGVFS